MYNVQHLYSDTQNIILNTVPGAGSYYMYSNVHKDFINLISHESLISRDNSSKGAGGGGPPLL